MKPMQKNYCSILEIPEAVISVAASKSFFPVVSELFSRWLVIDKGERYLCTKLCPSTAAGGSSKQSQRGDR